MQYSSGARHVSAIPLNANDCDETERMFGMVVLSRDRNTLAAWKNYQRTSKRCDMEEMPDLESKLRESSPIVGYNPRQDDGGGCMEGTTVQTAAEEELHLYIGSQCVRRSSKASDTQHVQHKAS